MSGAPPVELRWPLAVGDFEASGLTARSYPIEVGLIVWRAPDAQPAGWSTLIRPTPGWQAHREWSADAEAVHGISRDELEAGVTPTAAITAMNSVLSGLDRFWCDGGAWDIHWARTLVRASGVRPLWGLGSWDMLLATLDLDVHRRMAAWLDAHTPVHRARADAERLVRGLIHGLKFDVGPTVDHADVADTREGGRA